MNLHGSIAELQNAVVQIYNRMQQRFVENRVISDLWSAMANDVSRQTSSLKDFPASFWSRLKNERDGLAKAVSSSANAHASESIPDLSLSGCIELSLKIEEPVILKVYVPLIRSLRDNQANQSLEFYIMVKSHLARINRVTQSYSGNPLVIQRSNLLLQNFEKEVQEQQPPPVAARVSGSASKTKRLPKPLRKVSKRISRPLAKRPLGRSRRTKPLVEKVEIRRRRVRR